VPLCLVIIKWALIWTSVFGPGDGELLFGRGRLVEGWGNIRGTLPIRSVAPQVPHSSETCSQYLPIINVFSLNFRCYVVCVGGLFLCSSVWFPSWHYRPSLPDTRGFCSQPAAMRVPLAVRRPGGPATRPPARRPRRRRPTTATPWTSGGAARRGSGCRSTATPRPLDTSTPPSSAPPPGWARPRTAFPCPHLYASCTRLQPDLCGPSGGPSGAPAGVGTPRTMDSVCALPVSKATVGLHAWSSHHWPTKGIQMDGRTKISSRQLLQCLGDPPASACPCPRCPRCASTAAPRTPSANCRRPS